MPIPQRLRVRSVLLIGVVAVSMISCSDSDGSSVDSNATVRAPLSTTTSVSATAPASTTAKGSTTTTTTTTSAPPATAPQFDPAASNVELSVIEEPETGTPNDALLTRLDGAFSGDVIWAFPRVHDLPRLAAIGWFEGAVEGCGSGGVGMAIVADDSGTVRWEVLRGTGTLDLERLTAVGVGDWDLGSASGTLSVGVTCVDESDPLDSRTTLVGLAPTVDAPPGPVEALYGMGPGDTTRLRLDPTVLAGYPGITFNDVSVQPDSFVPGFETAHVEAILTSPAFSGVGSMNVGVLWQRWTSGQSCPGEKVQLLVGRNWPAGSGFTLAWQTVPDLSCGDAASGAWEPSP